MISIDWLTKVITVPQSFLVYVSPGQYELDVNEFRLALKAIEDDGDGMAFDDTHEHATEQTLSGVTFARLFKITNGYTVTFEDVGTPYTVVCTGANHNIADVKNINQVSLVIGNSAGLITVSTSGGSGDCPTTAQIAAAVVAALQAATIPVDVAKMNGAAVLGTGKTGDLWRGAQ